MSHRDYLLQTLELAKTRRGFCAPNPSVGALIEQHGQVIAKGVTQSPGSHHAEIMALRDVEGLTDSATLYVSLEPCTHWGKTPPCFDEIIKSGIKKVVFAFFDPNPLLKRVDTIKAFEDKGVSCEQVNIPEIEAFYLSYLYWTTHNRPFVTAKIAQSLDGKIAGPDGETIQLTGDTLAQFTHKQRLETDFILTTAHTVLNDNPKFNVRYKNTITEKTLGIVDSKLRLNGTENVFKHTKKIVIFYDENLVLNDTNRIKQVDYHPVKKTASGLSLSRVIELIGRMGIHDVWLEGGGCCFTHSLLEKYLNRVYLYITPIFLGESHKNTYQSDLTYTFNNNSKIKWRVEENELIGCFDFDEGVR
jgi:diaminohydroxyphosphoribosylaminopyrimidine deaminase/5-amino-6-(5-phosphoribosylamino)uracil reductase